MDKKIQLGIIQFFTFCYRFSTKTFIHHQKLLNFKSIICPPSSVLSYICLVTTDDHKSLISI